MDNGKRFGALCLAMVGAMLLTGCQAAAPDLAQTGEVHLDKAHAKGVHILWAEVRPDGGDTVVTGSLRPRGAGSRRLRGHLDVVLICPEGNIVRQAHSGEIILLLRGPGRGPTIRRFSVRLKGRPPSGATVRVAFHHGKPCRA